MLGLKTYHPIVNFVYFLFVIVFSCVFMHPVFLGISLLGGILFSTILFRKKAAKQLILFLPICFFMALINPLFNHQGVTVLAYFPNGNALTLESVLYGISSAVLLFNVMLWFSCFHKVLTSDKIQYLFSKSAPTLALIFSMTLRFVPRFFKQLKNVKDAKRGMGQIPKTKNVILRAKYGLSVLSSATTWALEDALCTADSMKARGYGIGNRTSYTIFRFSKRDICVLCFVCLLGFFLVVGTFLGYARFSYFPFIKGVERTPFSIGFVIFYIIFCLLPTFIEYREVRKWNALNSKM